MCLVREHIDYKVRRLLEEDDHGTCDKFIRDVEAFCLKMRSQLAMAAGGAGSKLAPVRCPECGATTSCHHHH